MIYKISDFDFANIADGFFNYLFTSIFEIIKFIISVLTYPLDQLLRTFFPNFDVYYSYVNDFFNLIFGVLEWVLSYSGLYQSVLSVIFGLIIIIITLPLAAHSIKIAIKWIAALT